MWLFLSLVLLLAVFHRNFRMLLLTIVCLTMAFFMFALTNPMARPSDRPAFVEGWQTAATAPAAN